MPWVAAGMDRHCLDPPCMSPSLIPSQLMRLKTGCSNVSGWECRWMDGLLPTERDPDPDRTTTTTTHLLQFRTRELRLANRTFLSRASTEANRGTDGMDAQARPGAGWAKLQARWLLGYPADALSLSLALGIHLLGCNEYLGATDCIFRRPVASPAFPARIQPQGEHGIRRRTSTGSRLHAPVELGGGCFVLMLQH